MKRHDAEERVLRRVVVEARLEPAPAVDWTAVEEGLILAASAQQTTPVSPPVGRRPQTRPERSSRPRYWILAAAGIPVALGLGALALSAEREERASSATQVSVEKTDPGAEPIDGSRLAPGALLVADGSALVVAHGDRAVWSLHAPVGQPAAAAPAKQGAVRVRQVGVPLVIDLESGSVEVDVFSTPHMESFVVIAGKTRIAVRGTAFRVERQSAGVLVEVAHGAVAVRSIDGKPEWVLHAPARAVFSLDGIRQDTLLNDSPPSRAAGSIRSAPHAPMRGSAAAQPPAAAPHDLSSGAAKVAAVVDACFKEHTAQRGDMRVSAATTMRLRVLPSGRVAEASFQPPLAPLIERCAATRIEAITFSASSQGAEIVRDMELER